VICDVFHKRPTVGEHVLLLIGFDRNRQVFLAKNHWGDGAFIASPKSRHQRSHV
jgi:hypothetical protein